MISYTQKVSNVMINSHREIPVQCRQHKYWCKSPAAAIEKPILFLKLEMCCYIYSCMISYTINIHLSTPCFSCDL